MISAYLALSVFAVWVPLCAGHASIWHPSMWGFNVTGSTFPYDNRPVVPLYNMTFKEWWFHGHLDYPPHPNDFFELPAGGVATAEVACTKAATSYYASADGPDVRDGNNPCPGSPLAAIHTNGFDDLKGCAMAIAYKDDVNDVKPEDFTVFSVNHACVWTRYTDFPVPERMPPCPEGGCTCAWFWIHSPDSGSEQNYMNGFKCKVTNSTSNVPLAKPQLPRRCGAEPDNGRPNPSPGNCTYGAKQPFYWLQQESNNMHEGYYSPPFYNDLYNFKDGAQNDIFVDSYESIPPPSPDSTVVPTPVDRSPSASGIPKANPTSATLPFSTQSSMPTSPTSTSSPQPGSKQKLCKLHNAKDAQAPLSRRSYLPQGFLSRSKKRNEQRPFSLWHPF